MAEDGQRLPQFLRSGIESAGRQLAEARRAYESAKHAARSDLPLAEDGRARIVCRRHAERRAVRVDGSGRPECVDPEHPDCQGCVEDVRAGTIETWEPNDSR
ncbi:MULTISPECIES: hypothetical protein [unclassified Halorhabdus]|uniref:DUF7091 family protein n=1 Tax=unclassified Halorhabdus TaxID=2621901 RepID=UPI0023DBD4FF|nr:MULTISPECIES: hypothetical protein [unclassified Halorhabdus]WEL19018.1 Uncharacterized protein SVXHr_2882 [Halorhabdus sp. SVX81]WEL22848.1 Uncharacterized protein HBNXHr_2819 [Halorhabdus sp. BNX81]